MTTLTPQERQQVNMTVYRSLKCDFDSHCYETVKWRRTDGGSPYDQYRCQKHYKVDERRYRRWDEDAYQRNVRYNPGWTDPDPYVARHAREWERFDVAAEREHLTQVAEAKALTEKRAAEVEANAVALARAGKALAAAQAAYIALAPDATEQVAWEKAFKEASK